MEGFLGNEGERYHGILRESAPVTGDGARLGVKMNDAP